MKKKDPVVEAKSDKFTGVRVVENFKHIDELFKNGKLFVDDSLDEDKSWYPNLCLVLKSSGKQSALARVSPDGKSVLLIKKSRDFFDVRPRNKEQQLLFDMLDDEKIKVLTITGRAGTGKSLITGAWIVDQLTTGKVDKIVISKPMEIVGTSRYYGTVPGDQSEKFEPFLINFRYLFTKLAGDKGASYFDMFVQKGKIEFMPLELMRGVSFADNTIVYLDEAQNIDGSVIKTLGTRIGEGCRLLISGDYNQIDNKTKDFKSGLLQVIDSEIFRKSSITGHIHMLKCERGDVAELFSEIFGDE